MSRPPITKPRFLFDRNEEWRELSEFVTSPLSGLRLGVLYGRRRQGKSEILQQLCDSVGGLYSLALEQQARRMAIDRFGNALGAWAGLDRRIAFATWEDALITAVQMAGERAARTGATQTLVLDEFPFLLADAPELPGILQAAYDRFGPTGGRRNPSVRLVLCGSALSVMTELLAETKALYGRAMLNMCLGAFDHRDTAKFWGVDDLETAFRLHAVVGGIPGYRELTANAPVPQTVDEFDEWVCQTMLNPAHALFDEVDLLFSQEPGIKERAMYFGILAALAQGESTPARIAAAVGRDARTLAYPLRVLRRAGFVDIDHDMLLNRKPVVSIADPVMRFHEVVTLPRLQLFQRRGMTRRGWREAQQAFSPGVLGPHFEHLAREWTITTLAARAGVEVGWTGTTAVACRKHRISHQVDVVSLSPGASPRTATAQVTLLGEAKATNKQRGLADLERLEHIRDLLGDRAMNARLALFSRTGFDAGLAAASRAGRVLAFTLADLYDPLRK